MLVLLYLLNDIFDWYAHCIILSKSSLRFDDKIKELLMVEKSKLSAANSFALKHNPCGESLM